MARLVYSGITSLDGYVEDASGGFEWAAPDEEVHAFVDDLERPIGTYLYGRAMYDTMTYWQDPPDLEQGSAAVRDFAAIWQAADKIVYSRTLAEARTPRTRVERDFAAGPVRELKAAAEADLSVGGSQLGAHALRLGLVDEIHQLLHPVVVGGGKPFLPDGVRLGLELVDQRSFSSGVVHLHYRVR